MIRWCVGILVLLLTTPAFPAPDPFSLDKLHTIHLHVTAKAWDQMQPSQPNILLRIFGAKPATRPATQAAYAEGDRLKPSPMGNQYAYAKATVEFDGEKIEAGLRFKGNSSYWSAQGGYQRPMKIDFHRFDHDQRFRGMAELNLHNSAFDPSQMREILSYMLLRDAAIPAPRVAYAAVYLTIDGKFTDRYIGLYTLVEEVDKIFLKQHYKSGKGLLMKPEGLFGGIMTYGDQWQRYKDKYRPKDEPDEDQKKRVIEFSKLVINSDDATFKKQIGAMLDVDEFLRFFAMTTLLANTDSFLTTGHNFYLYLDPATQKFSFLPWDLNLSIGAFGWVGSPSEHARLSIMKPHISPNRLVDRLLAIDEYAAAYRALIKTYSTTVFAPDKTDKQVALLEKLIAAAAKLEKTGAEPRNDGSAKKLWGGPPEIRQFLKDRMASVQDQLAGKDAGYTPSFKPFGIFGLAGEDKPATRPSTPNRTAPPPPPPNHPAATHPTATAP